MLDVHFLAEEHGIGIAEILADPDAVHAALDRDLRRLLEKVVRHREHRFEEVGIVVERKADVFESHEEPGGGKRTLYAAGEVVRDGLPELDVAAGQERIRAHVFFEILPAGDRIRDG